MKRFLALVLALVLVSSTTVGANSKVTQGYDEYSISVDSSVSYISFQLNYDEPIFEYVLEEISSVMTLKDLCSIYDEMAINYKMSANTEYVVPEAKKFQWAGPSKVRVSEPFWTEYSEYTFGQTNTAYSARVFTSKDGITFDENDYYEIRIPAWSDEEIIEEPIVVEEETKEDIIVEETKSTNKNVTLSLTANSTEPITFIRLYASSSKDYLDTILKTWNYKGKAKEKVVKYTFKDNGRYVLNVNSKDSYSTMDIEISTIKTLRLDSAKKSLAVGKTFKITSPSSASISYKSSNSKIAKVNKNGKVTAVKKGTATITVTDSYGATNKCKITVK